MITARQLKILTDLENVLLLATESGLLDVLSDRSHPDTVNCFCDAVEDLVVECKVPVTE